MAHDLDIRRALRDRPELWDLFTRREEYFARARDMFDRYPRFLSSNTNLLEPRVSCHLMERGFRPSYPHGKRFAILLSHDIDFVFEKPEAKLTKAVDAFAHRNWPGMMHNIRYLARRREPYWNFDEIMRVEESHDVRSTFFFMANGRAGDEVDYLVDDVKGAMTTLDAGGWEVGLHGSLDAYLDPEVMLREKGLIEKTLGKGIEGYRGHFLKFKAPDTWEALAKAGFSYDSTLGFADCIGFRNGMCHPHRPFNLTTEAWIDIHEVPLVLMDNTPFESMRLETEVSWGFIKGLLDEVERCSGAVSLLWHNSNFQGEMLKLYERILSYGNERHAWMTTGRDLLRHWRDGQDFSYSIG